MTVRFLGNYWWFAPLNIRILDEFKDNSSYVHTDKWQAVDVSKKPDFATHELLNASFGLNINALKPMQKDIKPNLPWADNHFEERVCGMPINPGVEWENWPYAGSARKFLEADGGKFNHNYMERYWPRVAGYVREPTLTAEEMRQHLAYIDEDGKLDRRGIYHRYGDLSDVVNQLASDPSTRQAYMPVFFPEDTGAVHGGRIPCSLGYHFIVRDSRLHVVYYLRSCDYVRHFRDDVYLTCRLGLWVLDRLRERDERWTAVKPGMLTMHITSFHMFAGDYINLFGAPK